MKRVGPHWLSASSPKSFDLAQDMSFGFRKKAKAGNKRNRDDRNSHGIGRGEKRGEN
jgi:hypothetical protein